METPAFTALLETALAEMLQQHQQWFEWNQRRIERAMNICKIANAVSRDPQDRQVYHVVSEVEPHRSYLVHRGDKTCTCPDYQKNSQRAGKPVA